MYFTAIDIDATAAHMAYVQLSLLGLSGVVVRANALGPLDVTPEQTWLTPMHYRSRWAGRIALADMLAAAKEAVELAPAADALQASGPNAAAPAPSTARPDQPATTVVGAGQLALF
jgi:hypothetical protein